MIRKVVWHDIQIYLRADEVIDPGCYVKQTHQVKRNDFHKTGLFTKYQLLKLTYN